MKKLLLVSLIVVVAVVTIGFVGSDLMITHYGSMPKPGN